MTPPLEFEGSNNLAQIAASSTARKRGGQPGNSNRLRHGRYTKATTARRAETRAWMRKANHLVMRATMVWRARKALAKKTASPLWGSRRAHAIQQRPLLDGWGRCSSSGTPLTRKPAARRSRIFARTLSLLAPIRERCSKASATAPPDLVWIS